MPYIFNVMKTIHCNYVKVRHFLLSESFCGTVVSTIKVGKHPRTRSAFSFQECRCCDGASFTLPKHSLHT